MTFHIEAYPQGYPEFAVPVIEDKNVTPAEHSAALSVAAQEATRRFKEQHPYERMGAAIVYACHEDIVGVSGFNQTLPTTSSL